jgi:hypothetical protein
MKLGRAALALFFSRVATNSKDRNFGELGRQRGAGDLLPIESLKPFRDNQSRHVNQTAF